ncbi:hypothetical protein HRE60_10760 (plasmid) [Streptococcus salivarius]|uniref:Uncharacterized protein n=1 Tax=Streptococcus salivarius TaxID=1304 RepID=A0A7L6WNR1_STRSL|nr:hypothetical protein [Streptococcus salivarius]QMI52156.1 hypothetical protein HRE60_10760 [Streptococcus salivarius]
MNKRTLVRVLTAVFGFVCLVASMKPVIEDNGSGWVYLIFIGYLLVMTLYCCLNAGTRKKGEENE